MPIETGTYVNDLVQNNPPGSDDRSQGDNHLRLIKSVLKNTFPNASKAFRFPTSAAIQTSTVTVLFPTDQNKVFPVDTTAGSVAVNLPDPTAGGTVDEDGFAITVVRMSAGNNALTVSGSGGQLIGGSSTYSLFGLFQVAHVVWSKTAARWFVTSANFLEELVVETTEGGRTPLQVQHTDNTAAEQAMVRLRRGTGAGAQFIVNTTGDAANGVADVRFYNALTELIRFSGTSFIQAARNFFVGVAGTAANWGVLISGYVQQVDLGTPGFSPGANTTLSYFKTGIHTAKDSAGVERSLEAGQVVAVVEDQKTQNTSGGTFTSGADQTRVLNTLAFVRSVPAGALVTLATNQFTITQAGSWEIKWSAPAHGVNSHQSLLRNVTDGVDVARGSSDWAPAFDFGSGDGGGNVQSVSFGRAVVTITAAKTFEIRHRCQSTQATIGFGLAANLGAEVYTRVIVRRA